MSTGNVLYLVMVVAAFVSFSAVLAYQSWQQARLGRETVPASTEHADPHGAIPA